MYFIGRFWVKTLTYDNSKGFCGHALVDAALNSTGYFARPFASWERGSNENFNGLLRQYVPMTLKGVSALMIA
jgi:IS30 family transposase